MGTKDGLWETLTHQQLCHTNIVPWHQWIESWSADSTITNGNKAYILISAQNIQISSMYFLVCIRKEDILLGPNRLQ